jgi:raffinose/stachyose/melibiose transport system permease protein
MATSAPPVRRREPPGSPGVGRPEAPARRSTPLRLRDVTSLLYVVPAIAVVGVVIYYGIGYTAWLSLQRWDGIGPDAQFAGLDNFRRLADDPVVRRALWHSVVFGAVTLSAQMVLGFTIALLLHSRVVLRSLWKIVVFMPVVLAPAVMAPTFRAMLASGGSVNELLALVGLGVLARPWLADPSAALWALMGVQVWNWTGLSFILYYAALTQVEPEVLEAARIDGAGNARLVRHILVPLLRPVHVTLIVLGTIGTLKFFDLVYLLTRGGPFHATEFLSTYIYRRGISEFQAGYAAALAIFLLVLSLTISAIQFRRLRHSET